MGEPRKSSALKELKQSKNSWRNDPGVGGDAGGG